MMGCAPSEAAPANPVTPANSAPNATAPSVPVEMPVLDHPGDQIEWVINHRQPAMVLFHSNSCVACRVMEQTMARVQPDYAGRITFISVRTDDRANLDLVRSVGIRAIPTSFFLRDGESVDMTVGAMRDDALRATLDTLLTP
jgi:thioredoxin 1